MAFNLMTKTNKNILFIILFSVTSLIIIMLLFNKHESTSSSNNIKADGNNINSVNQMNDDFPKVYNHINNQAENKTFEPKTKIKPVEKNYQFTAKSITPLLEFNPGAKSSFLERTEVSHLDEKHFMNFEYSLLDNLTIGNQIALRNENDEILNFIISDIAKIDEELNVKAWELANEYGEPIGNIVGNEQLVEGSFISPSGEQYLFFSENGAAWIASEQALLMVDDY